MVTLKKIRTQHGVAMGKKKVRNRRIADEGLQDFPLGFTKYKIIQKSALLSEIMQLKSAAANSEFESGTCKDF